MTINAPVVDDASTRNASAGMPILQVTKITGPTTMAMIPCLTPIHNNENADFKIYEVVSSALANVDFAWFRDHPDRNFCLRPYFKGEVLHFKEPPEGSLPLLIMAMRAGDGVYLKTAMQIPSQLAENGKSDDGCIALLMGIFKLKVKPTPEALGNLCNHLFEE